MNVKNLIILLLPVVILNIGGIANVTNIDIESNIYSSDIGPGNCLIDQWIRFNSRNKKRYDVDGKIAQSGKINDKILFKALDKWQHKNDAVSYDIKDFDLSFVRGLSLEDGAATLTEYTSEILYNYLNLSVLSGDNIIIVSGGGRKNKFLINSIEKKTKRVIKLIDDFGINGDFIESQAFAYLAVRSMRGLPFTWKNTTGVKNPTSGGLLNFVLK